MCVLPDLPDKYVYPLIKDGALHKHIKTGPQSTTATAKRVQRGNLQGCEHSSGVAAEMYEPGKFQYISKFGSLLFMDKCFH